MNPFFVLRFFGSIFLDPSGWKNVHSLFSFLPKKILVSFLAHGHTPGGRPFLAWWLPVTVYSRWAAEVKAIAKGTVPPE